MVNQQGKRFFNEEQVQNTTYTGNSLRNQTGNTGFMILDEAIKQSYVEANHVDFTSRVWNTDDFTQFDANFKTMEESGYTAIVKADTLEELANKMGIDPQGLAATVAARRISSRSRLLRSMRRSIIHPAMVRWAASRSIPIWKCWIRTIRSSRVCTRRARIPARFTATAICSCFRATQWAIPSTPASLSAKRSANY